MRDHVKTDIHKLAASSTNTRNENYRGPVHGRRVDNFPEKHTLRYRYTDGKGKRKEIMVRYKKIGEDRAYQKMYEKIEALNLN